MPRGAARARRPHRASDHAGPLARTRSQLVGKVAQPKCSPAKMVLQSYIDACMVRYVCAVLHLSIVGVPVLNTTAGTSGSETSALDIELSTTASQDGAVTQLCRSYHRPCPSLPSFVVVLTGIPAVNCGATRNIFYASCVSSFLASRCKRAAVEPCCAGVVFLRIMDLMKQHSAVRFCSLLLHSHTVMLCVYWCFLYPCRCREVLSRCMVCVPQLCCCFTLFGSCYAIR